MIVLDASAAVEWLLDLPAAGGVEGHLAAGDIHAPDLLLVEVAQVIRRHERSGAIDAERAREAIEDLADLDVSTHRHAALLDGIWVRRSFLTAYDAAYVTLADALEAPLVSLDLRLAAAHHGIEVIVPS